MRTLTAKITEQAAEHVHKKSAHQNNRRDTVRSGKGKSILLVFSTRYGHTAKIVQQLENALKLLGHETIVLRAGRDSPQKLQTLAKDISCIILGGPIYLSRFSRALSDFIDQYRDVMKSIPSAFFSVSLPFAYDGGEKKNAVREIMKDFFANNHWQPCRSASFAGALLYTHYGPVIRFIMRRISQSAGGDTNIHRDYVYTDWNEIPVFAQKIDSMIKLAAVRQQ